MFTNLLSAHPVANRDLKMALDVAIQTTSNPELQSGLQNLKNLSETTPELAYILKCILQSKKLSGKKFGDDLELARLLEEFKVLETHANPHMTKHFALLAMIAHVAQKKNHFLGWGRGAYPSSLILYAVGLSDVHPLTYGLLFERFLVNDSEPTIDIECQDRDGLIVSIQREIGSGNVAEMSISHLLKIKPAIKYVLQERKISSEVCNALLADINQISGGKFDTLSVFEQNEIFEQVTGPSSHHHDFFTRHVGVKEQILKHWRMPADTGKHPSAVILSFNKFDGGKKPSWETNASLQQSLAPVLHESEVSGRSDLLRIGVLRSKYLESLSFESAHKIDFTSGAVYRELNKADLPNKFSECLKDIRAANPGCMIEVCSIEDMARVLALGSSEDLQRVKMFFDGKAIVYQEQIIEILIEHGLSPRDARVAFMNMAKGYSHVRIYSQIKESPYHNLNDKTVAQLMVCSMHAFSKAHAIAQAHLYFANAAQNSLR